MVGDRVSDRMAAEAAGVTFVEFQGGDLLDVIVRVASGMGQDSRGEGESAVAAASTAGELGARDRT